MSGWAYDLGCVFVGLHQILGEAYKKPRRGEEPNALRLSRGTWLTLLSDGCCDGCICNLAQIGCTIIKGRTLGLRIPRRTFLQPSKVIVDAVLITKQRDSGDRVRKVSHFSSSEILHFRRVGTRCKSSNDGGGLPAAAAANKLRRKNVSRSASAMIAGSNAFAAAAAMFSGASSCDADDA